MPDEAPDASDPHHAGEATPSAPGPAAQALAQADALLAKGDPAAALAALRCARPEAGGAAGDAAALRAYLRRQALCRIAIAAESSSADAWWDVFGLDAAAAAAAADARRQFRRLSTLVHPDKGGSAEAFAALQDGLEALLEALEPGQGAAKRRRQVSGGDEGEADDDGFAWWTEWDDLGRGEADVAQKEEKKAAEAVDNAELAALDAEALAAEVRARQGALLGPLPPGATLDDLKGAIWRARAALNAKLEEPAALGAPAGGGFLPDSL